MILVDNQGSGAHAFWGFSHAAWNGWTLADLVFPLFLFAAGGAMALARARPSTGKLLRRALLLFGIGLALNALPPTSLAHLPILGVLQRIALAWVLAALVVRHLSARRQVQVAIWVLLLYWAALSLLPMRPDLSLPGLVDRAVMGTAHMYRPGYDPQGLLATVPAIVSVLAGYWAVRWLRAQPRCTATALRLVAAGLAALAAGEAWGLVFPINKRLWTSSFVLVGAGVAAVATAIIYLAVDVWGIRRGRALEVLGTNALVVFVGAEALTGVLRNQGIRASLYEALFHPLLGARPGSLAYGLVIVVMWWGVARLLWGRRLFLRV